MKQYLFTVFYILLICLVTFAQNDSKSRSKTDKIQKANSNSSIKGSKVVEGVVRLHVTFLASGEIGEITVVSGVDGLTELAIAAARKIKFEPAKKNGVAYTVKKLVEYSFTPDYFNENDEGLQKNAEITEMPAPKYPKGNSLSGKVKLKLILFPEGNVKISEVKSDLPKEFEDNARDAASKIKFKPAIDKNGKEVTQTKEVIYEFKPQTN